MNEFIDMVFRMRSAQKRYFETRQLTDLNESKRLEKQVDQAIYNYQNKSLFS